MNDMTFSSTWLKPSVALNVLQAADEENFGEPDAILEKVEQAYKHLPGDSPAVKFEKTVVLDAVKEHRAFRAATSPQLEYLATMSIPQVLEYLAKGFQEEEELLRILRYFNLSHSVCVAVLAHSSISYALVANIFHVEHASKGELYYPLTESKIRTLLENPMFFLLLETTEEQGLWTSEEILNDILNAWARDVARDLNLDKEDESSWGDVSYKDVLKSGENVLHPGVYNSFVQADMVDETIDDKFTGHFDLQAVFVYLMESLNGQNFGAKILALESFWNDLLGTTVNFPRPQWMKEP